MLPPVAILCGGRGTRLRAAGAPLPKALVEVGGRPIVWHVIQLYRAQGFRRFVLLTGYLAGLIEAFVGSVDWGAEVAVQCLETGLDTPTGGRVRAALAAGALGCADAGCEPERFCLTYADGVSDVDLGAVLAAHAADSRRTATVTLVRPRLPFGVATLGSDGLISAFAEKPLSEDWINGGFMCLEPSVRSVLSDDCALEGEPLQRLAFEGRLGAFRHHGFWQCMDTYKDATALDELWSNGRAPWRTW